MSFIHFQNRFGQDVNIYIHDYVNRELRVVKDSIVLEFKNVRGYDDICPTILAKQLSMSLVCENMLEFQTYFTNDFAVLVTIDNKEIFFGEMLPFTIQESIAHPPYIVNIQAIDFSRNYKDNNVFKNENLQNENDELYLNNNTVYCSAGGNINIANAYNAPFSLSETFIRKRFLHNKKYKDILEFFNSSLQVTFFWEGGSAEAVSLFFHDYKDYNINELDEKRLYNQPFLSFAPQKNFSFERKDNFDEHVLIDAEKNDITNVNALEAESLVYNFFSRFDLEIEIDWSYYIRINTYYPTTEKPAWGGTIPPIIGFSLELKIIDSFNITYYYNFINNTLQTTIPPTYTIYSSPAYPISSQVGYYDTKNVKVQIANSNFVINQGKVVVKMISANVPIGYDDAYGNLLFLEDYVLEARVKVKTKKNEIRTARYKLYSQNVFIKEEYITDKELPPAKLQQINNSFKEYAETKNLTIAFSSFNSDKSLQNIYHLENSSFSQDFTDVYLKRILETQYKRVQTILNAELDWDLARTINPLLPFRLDYGAGNMMFNLVRGTLNLESMILSGEFVRRYNN